LYARFTRFSKQSYEKVGPPYRAAKQGSKAHAQRDSDLGPASFGNTTLVSVCIAGGKRPVAWLSLDEGDNDAACFLAYMAAALQTRAPNIGDVFGNQ
jgi:hypothetical protein